MLNSLIYSFLSCLKKDVMMFASFHSNGTIPSSNDKLNTAASGKLICSTISSTNFERMPTTTGDLFFFISLISLATIFVFITSLSDSLFLPSSLVSGNGNWH